MKKLSTMPLKYWPGLQYFWNTIQLDYVVLTDQFQYTKRSPLTISSPFPESSLNMRIPIRHEGKALDIFQKKIDVTSNWKKNHLKTLKHYFHNEPYAYYYMPQLEELYEKPNQYLAEFLEITTKKILVWLYSKTKIIRASRLKTIDDNNRFVIESCQALNCEHYLNDPVVFRKKYVDKSVLEEKCLKVSFFIPFSESKLFSLYKTNNILAYLMHYGPEAGFLLRQFMPENK